MTKQQSAETTERWRHRESSALSSGIKEFGELQISRVLREVVDVRREIGDFLTPCEMDVLVPRCFDCYFHEKRLFEEPVDRWPDVGVSTWKQDLVEYGVTEEQIEYIDEVFWEVPVMCFHCRRELTYGSDDVYVEVVPLEAYVECLPVNVNKLAQRIEAALLQAYGGRCCGCNAALTLKQATFDHILRRADGGWALLANMQPICLACKVVKDRGELSNGPRDPVVFTYTFPLRPAPSVHDVAFW